MEPLRPSHAIALTAVLAAAVFAPGLRGPFLGEARELIADNPLVHGFSHSLVWVTSSAGITGVDPAQVHDGLHAYRPLISMSHAFDWALGQGSPVPFHLTNLFFHVVAAVLAYLTLHRWTGDSSAALVAALCFALHPTKANAVAGLSARDQIVCSVGMLMALRGLWMRLRGQHLGLLTEIVGLVVAFGASEQALALPALALVEAWIAAGRGSFRRIHRGLILRSTVVYAVIALAYVILRATLLGPAANAPTALRHLALVLESAGRLAELAVWPADLAEGRSIKELVSGGGPAVDASYAALGAVVLLLLASAIAISARGRPRVAAAALTLLGLLLGSSNLLHTGADAVVSPAALYLPALGLGWLAVELLSPWVRSPARALATALLFAAALGSRAAVRAVDYASASRFWRGELVHPGARPRTFADAARAELSARRPRATLELISKTPFEARTSGSGRQLARSLHAGFAAAQRTIPDRPGDALRTLSAAARTLRVSSAASFELVPGLRLEVSSGTPLSRALTADPGSLERIELEIASRLGEDSRALEGVERLVERCPSCWHYRASAVTITARAGLLDEAAQHFERLRVGAPSEEVLAMRSQILQAKRAQKAAEQAPGKERIRYEVRYQAVLDGWGRAYVLGRPLFDRVPTDRDLAELLLEVAFRAGEREKAEELLARHLRDPECRAWLERWSTAMQWTDAPRTPDAEALPL